MKREYLKAILWPRQNDNHAPIEGPEGKLYRYAIVGVLVTDVPIQSLEGVNEILADGDCPGLSAVIDACSKRAPTFTPGEAGNALCDLDIL